MSIPRHLVDEIRARTDIVAVVGTVVTLRRQGRSWVGLCPFHSDRTPSFHVVPDKGFFHCFPCGAHGDVIAFLMKARGMSFVEAVKDLAGPAGVVIEERPMTPQEQRRIAVKADLHGVVEAAADYFHRTLMVDPDGAPGRAYLEARGITLETAERYRLGFAPAGWDRLGRHAARVRMPAPLLAEAGLVKRRERGEGFYDTFRNRLLFPILDERGRPVAFGGRLLPGNDEGPKYLNSPESPIYDKSRTLYGLSWARPAIQQRGRAILVEGYFDAVSLWQAGFGEAVATCGTALTAAHAEVLRRLAGIAVALFDADEAGLRAAVRAMDIFLDAGIEGRRLDLGDSKDPDEFVQRHGPPAFEALLAHGEPLVELVIRRHVEREGPTVEGRARALHALVPTMRRLPDLLRGPLAGRVAGLLGLREEQVLDAIARAPSPQRAPVAGEGGPSERVAPPRRRWMPTRELTHLLWLCVHHPAEVGPLLAQADPEDVSERDDVLAALVRLAEGEPLPAVLTDVADDDLRRALVEVAAREDLYAPEAVAPAADAILARLALPRLDRRIAGVVARLDACQERGDTSSYETLTREVSGLHAQRAALHARSTRRRASTGRSNGTQSRRG
jgi:DNA primase